MTKIRMRHGHRRPRSHTGFTANICNVEQLQALREVCRCIASRGLHGKRKPSERLARQRRRMGVEVEG